MSWLSIVATSGAAVIGAFAIRDLYACIGHMQRGILRFGAIFVPKHQREETYDQWYADMMAMPPSELWRTAYAIDCVRGGALIGVRVRWAVRQRAATTNDRVPSSYKDAIEGELASLDRHVRNIQWMIILALAIALLALVYEPNEFWSMTLHLFSGGH